MGSGVTTCSAGGGCPFYGTQSGGDLLIISDFSQGGPIASIAVYTWTSSNEASEALATRFGSAVACLVLGYLQFLTGAQDPSFR